jgi:hypothetical protein
VRPTSQHLALINSAKSCVTSRLFAYLIRDVGRRGRYVESAAFNFTAWLFWKRLTKNKRCGYIQKSMKIRSGVMTSDHERICIDTMIKLENVMRSLIG